MNVVSETKTTFLSRFKLFFALSRTPHGLLDMTTPALGAILWLGRFPDTRILLLGLLTTFAGYTAVYALNDLVDYRVDKKKLESGETEKKSDYLDDVLVRHPMARGLLTFKEGLCWTAAWFLIAAVGAYLLNPLCILIFLTGCTLEAIYCLLWRTSPFRTIVSGAVKTTGAIAAVFAVDPSPAPNFLSLLFLWLFFWEIGGQNIPADWTDMEEDRRLDAKTIPVRYGTRVAGVVILGTLFLAVMLSVFVQQASPFAGNPFVTAGFMLTGSFLLLVPACRLFRVKVRNHASILFNRASYYPVSLLTVVIVGGIIQGRV